MDYLLKIKKQRIDLLQKNNGWGKSKEEVKDLLDVLEIVDTDLEDLEEKPHTRILINTNELVSTINLDHQIELPIIELFIDNDNFVVFTTGCIYNCRNEITRKIGYENIVGLDENSINNALRDRLKRPHLFDVKLIMTNGESIPITIEYGISLHPIVSFLMDVNKETT